MYIASAYWGSTGTAATVVDRGLYIVAAGSITFLASEVLVNFVRIHGPVLDRSMPVTTLNENLGRMIVFIVGLAVVLHGLGLANHADAYRSWRGRSGCRTGAAGHTRESVRGFLPDGREAHPRRQLHQAVVGRGRVSRRHRLAREPLEAVVEQHGARAEREALAVDRHQLPLAGARNGRDNQCERRLRE